MPRAHMVFIITHGWRFAGPLLVAYFVDTVCSLVIKFHSLYNNVQSQAACSLNMHTHVHVHVSTFNT